MRVVPTVDGVLPIVYFFMQRGNLNYTCVVLLTEVMRLERHYLHSLAPGFDKDAVLQDLMKSYGDDVWNFAFFMTRKSEAADDISQEVFLTAYHRLYAFRGDCSVKSWLLTITRNKSLNYLKSAFIRRVTLVDIILHRNDSTPSAENVWFDQVESVELWIQVMKLPRKLREVLILSYHYELPIKETADLLQVSEGTVKSRLHRARAQMSRQLTNEREGE
jgi:RNA polymerase sigma-70 factor (ECF subfamily)